MKEVINFSKFTEMLTESDEKLHLKEVINFSKFTEMLTESDEKLHLVEISKLKERAFKSSSFRNEGLWSKSLLSFIRETSHAQLPALSWSTEKYYASKLRQSLGANEFDFFYFIGYARVTSLRMLFDTNMGFAIDDLNFIISVLLKYHAQTAEKVKILEIGCGTGELLTELYNRGYTQVEGIDMSPATIRKAKGRLRKYRIPHEKVHNLSLEEFQGIIQEERYDIVIHSDVIEHIAPDYAINFLGTVQSLLKPDGHMIVMTPSKLTGPHDDTRLFENPGTEPQGFHLQEYSLTDLEKILSEMGFADFETLNSLPSCNSYWDSLSEDNFRFKVRLEKILHTLDWKLRKPIVDGMYFKGFVCRKI